MADSPSQPLPRGVPEGREIDGVFVLDPISGRTVFVPAVLDLGPKLRAPTMEPEGGLAVVTTDALV